MIIENIFVFVLALVVGGSVALAWIIFALRREVQERASSLATFVSALQKASRTHAEQIAQISSKLPGLQASSPPAIAARVEELAEALERLRMTHQRFAGRVSQHMGADPRPDNAPPTVDRDALRREHAASIMPTGTKRG